MTGVEIISIYEPGGIIWDQEGNCSKFIDQGDSRGAFHRGTWIRCF